MKTTTLYVAKPEYPSYCQACRCGHAQIDHGVETGFRFPGNTFKGLLERIVSLGMKGVIRPCEQWCFDCHNFSKNPGFYADPVSNPNFLLLYSGPGSETMDEICLG